VHDTRNSANVPFDSNLKEPVKRLRRLVQWAVCHHSNRIDICAALAIPQDLRNGVYRFTVSIYERKNNNKVQT